ncbi:MAG: DJ-1/PfpI/YhbO family deglycase/protease [Micavibrio sp.]
MSSIPDDIYTATPVPPTRQERIAILTTDGTEDQEFFYPYYRFLEEGYAVDVLTPDGKDFKGKNGAGLEITQKIASARPEQYAMLYIPGGKAPAKLKKEEAALEFVRQFCASGRPVGAICHGPQLLAEAGVIDGCQIAAWPDCQKEVEEAGGAYMSKQCVHDGQFITGRWPADLPAQMKEIMQCLKEEGGAKRRAA